MYSEMERIGEESFLACLKVCKLRVSKFCSGGTKKQRRNKE
jgi:hypothetical protein